MRFSNEKALENLIHKIESRSQADSRINLTRAYKKQ